jgi:hypothetical protein
VGGRNMKTIAIVISASLLVSLSALAADTANGKVKHLHAAQAASTARDKMPPVQQLPAVQVPKPVATDNAQLPAVQNPKRPALQKPGLPVTPAGLEHHEAARAAQNAQQLEQLRRLEQARRGIGQTPAGAVDPAGGTVLGGKQPAPGAAGGGNPQPGSAARDCVRNPAGCVTLPGQRGRVAGQPGSPVSGMLKGDRSAASDTTTVSNTTDSDGNKITITSTERDDGSSTTRVETRDPQSSEPVSSSVTSVRPDGSSTTKGATHNVDGTTTLFSSALDAGGNPDAKHPPEATTVGEPEDGPFGQPGENTPGAGNDNCNWNPVLGRCTKPQTSHQDMTGQPGPGQKDTASTGTESSAPQLGSEAVTNPGDSNYSSGRTGGSGGGRPIDMRDPPKGVPGTEPVPPGGFAR